jgi:hypothetical protein
MSGSSSRSYLVKVLGDCLRDQAEVHYQLNRDPGASCLLSAPVARIPIDRRAEEGFSAYRWS